MNRLDVIDEIWRRKLKDQDAEIRRLQTMSDSELLKELEKYEPIPAEMLEAYKKGVEDEIKCVETSGEHFDLRSRLTKPFDRTQGKQE